MNASSHHKITPTADLICYFRQFSDTPYVKEIAEMTNAKEIAQKILGNHFEMSNFLAPMAEARYKRIDLQARKYKNILEVAVGRSPRDLIFTEDPSVTYVATDLPDSLENHKAIIEKLMSNHGLKRPNLKFAPVNVLDPLAFSKAANLLPSGPVAVISEGLMIYLAMEEKRLFLKNILSVISQCGGCLITSDIIIFPNRSGASNNFVSGLHQSIASTAGRKITDHGFENIEKAKDFISDCGFDSEVITDNVEIVSAKKLGLEKDTLTNSVSNFPIWVLTPKK